MDFALSEEQSAIFDMALAFGQDHIAPFARQWEADGTIPRDLWPELGELGFAALYVPEDSGGTGLTRLDATLVFEALSHSCASVAAFLSIHNMCVKMIDSFGSDDLRHRIMPGALTMNTVLSYCLTEPGSGSDAAALKTRADKTNAGYALTGTKAFISGGGYSDAYVIMARTGEAGPKGISAMVVEDGSDGLSFGGLEDKMGWRSQPTRQVQLDNCNIPDSNLLGEEGKGFTYAMMGLDGGRLNIAACSLGAAQSALDQTVAYMKERKAFGKPIDQFQGLQFRLADAEIALQSARTFLRQAAWKLDQGAPDATQFCAMAKKLCTEVGSDVADQCLQLHGGYGYLSDYGIEKIVRDLRVHQILEGTNEIMRLITARALIQMTDLIIRTTDKAGHITLNRPKALNALTYDMVLEIEKTLDAWRNSDVALVIIDARGDRAFCSGGDIADMYASGQRGDLAYGQKFWRDEYRLNAKIATYPKPIFSFLQGFTMGGGVGVGCHASHRIVGETSQIAMPECSIGLVPDVGGSYLLARAPGYIGTYLGLTGTRMNAADAITATFADHYIPEADWDHLKIQLTTGNMTLPQHTAPGGTLSQLRPAIDAAFKLQTLQDILRDLPADTALNIKALHRNAPLAMSCAVQIIARVRQNPSIQNALKHEYRYTHRAVAQGDFIEGIRAAIIDKDRSPRWQHASPYDVTSAEVDAMTSPLQEQELTL